MPSNNLRTKNRPSGIHDVPSNRARHSDNNQAVTEAWMAFQRLRPFPSQSAGSAKSWPLPRPTRISMDFQRRAVSTADPRPRTLPPIDTKFRPGNRKVSNVAKARPSENPWAIKWATHRSHHSAICDNSSSSRASSSAMTQIPYSGIRPPRQRKEIVNPSEKDIALYKRLQAVYSNTNDRVSRAEKLRESLGSMQKRIMNSEINASLRSYTKKVEEDKKSRRELKRVRDRYSRDKERRNRYSFVSLNALEAPQVPRKAYGLPDEGRELDLSGVTKKAQSELRNIWQKSMRRVALVQGIVKLSTAENGLRKIHIKRPAGRKRSRQGLIGENGRDSSEIGKNQENSSEPVRENLDVVMGEIDAIYTAISDSEDDLSDIAEEGI